MSHHIGKKLSALFQTLTTLTEDERGAKEEEVEEEEESRGVFSEAGSAPVSTDVGGGVPEKTENQMQPSNLQIQSPPLLTRHTPRHSSQEVVAIIL